MEGGPDRRVLVGGVLELQHRQRQAIAEEHHVRAAAVLVLGDAELVDREPVVACGIIEVDHPRLCAADRAISVAVLDGYAIDQQAVQRAVALDQIGTLGPDEVAERIVQRFGGQCWVEPGQRIAQPLRQHDLAVVAPLSRGHVRGDVGAVGHAPAGALQPGQGGLFDDGFREGVRHAPSHSPRIGTANSPPPKGMIAAPS